MENIDAKLAALGFTRNGSEWHKIQKAEKWVVFFSKPWDSWILERHTRNADGKYRMKGRDWAEYVYAKDLLEAIE